MIRACLLALAVLAVSCASTPNLAGSDPAKAYVVLKFDSQAMDRRSVLKDAYAAFTFSHAFNDQARVVYVKNTDRAEQIVELEPGTYRLAALSVKNGTTITNFKLPKEYLSFFRLNAGEVAYAGTFDLDMVSKLTTDSDLEPLKNTLVTRYPALASFTWVTTREDRPSF